MKKIIQFNKAVEQKEKRLKIKQKHYPQLRKAQSKAIQKVVSLEDFNMLSDSFNKVSDSFNKLHDAHKTLMELKNNQIQYDLKSYQLFEHFILSEDLSEQYLDYIKARRNREEDEEYFEVIDDTLKEWDVFPDDEDEISEWLGRG